MWEITKDPILDYLQWNKLLIMCSKALNHKLFTNTSSSHTGDESDVGCNNLQDIWLII